MLRGSMKVQNQVRKRPRVTLSMMGEVRKSGRDLCLTGANESRFGFEPSADCRELVDELVDGDGVPTGIRTPVTAVIAGNLPFCSPIAASACQYKAQPAVLALSKCGKK